MLEIRGLSAAYAATGTVALHDIHLRVRPGERVALLGPNGSGKTSLLRCITGQMPLMEGHVALQGSHLGTLAADERARRVAVLPQRAQYPQGMGVYDMVLLGRYCWRGFWGRLAGSGRSHHAACQQALAQTGTLGLARRTLGSLSGGELQRVLLARVLAQQSPLLLLDELAASLDVAHAIFLFDFLNACVDKTLVMVMHDCNLAARYATRLVGLKAGRIVFDGPTASTFTGENLHALYDLPFNLFAHPELGVPQAVPGVLPVPAAPAASPEPAVCDADAGQGSGTC